MVVLSKRLQCIANQVQFGSRIADIGSDHALLPTYLALQGMISYAIAGELNEGPLNAARKQVEQAKLQERIKVRQGDGLQVLNPGEVDTIIIAGMGGGLITEILSQGTDKLEGVEKLILQPNVGEDLVRRWLYEQDWYLQEEYILLEDGRIYEILLAVRPSPTVMEIVAEAKNDEDTLPKSVTELNHMLYTVDDGELCEEGLNQDWLFRFGPHLLRHASDAFVLKWEREIDKWMQICQQLSLSSHGSSRSKLDQYQNDIEVVRRVLDCLQKDKPLFNG